MRFAENSGKVTEVVDRVLVFDDFVIVVDELVVPGRGPVKYCDNLCRQ